MPIGEKGSIGMIRPFPDLIKLSISEITVPNNFPTVMSFAEIVTKESDGFDKIVVYYNEFKSAVSQVIRRMELLPRRKFLDVMKYSKLYN